MKKIVNFVILIVVCLLPVMVNAKANFSFEKDFIDKIFLYEENGKIYFVNTDSDGINAQNSLHIYNDKFELVEEKSLIVDFESFVENYSYKPFYEYMKYDMFVNDRYRLYSDSSMLYSVSYDDIKINYFNKKNQIEGEIYFYDDETFTKDILGKKFDIYTHFDDLDCRVLDIEQFDNYFVVVYYNEDYDSIVSIIDDKFNVILNFEYEYFEYEPIVYIYDNLIYVKKDNKTIEVYKLDGTKADTLYISHELIERYDNDNYPYYLDFKTMYIVNNSLYLTYDKSCYNCVERFYSIDVSDLVKSREAERPMTLKYELDYDVNVVFSSNGEFTYENKVDEDGKSYVELKITPNEGYSVKEIIVTDINGNRIDVTNNKFYKPMNDVRVEVKYVQGEYLPIPDTFLGKSITLILIGLILIGLGLYTVNYVKREN